MPSKSVKCSSKKFSALSAAALAAFALVSLTAQAAMTVEVRNKGSSVDSGTSTIAYYAADTLDTTNAFMDTADGFGTVDVTLISASASDQLLFNVTSDATI